MAFSALYTEIAQCESQRFNSKLFIYMICNINLLLLHWTEMLVEHQKA